jgi:hypothetical protein
VPAGPDDTILINKNNIGHIIRLYSEGDYAVAEGILYDPEKVSGKYKEDIEYVQNMHSMGCYPPVSIAINCDWDGNENAGLVREFRGNY